MSAPSHRCVAPLSAEELCGAGAPHERSVQVEGSDERVTVHLCPLHAAEVIAAFGEPVSARAVDDHHALLTWAHGERQQHVEGLARTWSVTFGALRAREPSRGARAVEIAVIFAAIAAPLWLPLLQVLAVFDATRMTMPIYALLDWAGLPDGTRGDALALASTMLLDPEEHAEAEFARATRPETGFAKSWEAHQRRRVALHSGPVTAEEMSDGGRILAIPPEEHRDAEVQRDWRAYVDSGLPKLGRLTLELLPSTWATRWQARVDQLFADTFPTAREGPRVGDPAGGAAWTGPPPG